MESKYTHKQIKRGFGGVSEVTRDDGQILWLVAWGHGEKQASIRPAFNSTTGPAWWDFTFRGGGDYSRLAQIPNEYNFILDCLPWGSWQAVYEKAGDYYYVTTNKRAYAVPFVDFSAELVELGRAAFAVYRKEVALRGAEGEYEMATCKNCGREFDIQSEDDWMEADDGGDICGECVREANANIPQPEYPVETNRA